ncbi:MAG: sensor histidine kinase [Nocardioides sp.]
MADRRRVAAIEKYAVLDRPPRADLTALVELAATLSGAPFATVELVTDTRQHQVAASGGEPRDCDVALSFAARVLDAKSLVVIPDLTRDRRFADHPYVTRAERPLRSYAGHPLTAPDGTVIGALSVYDERVRTLTDHHPDAFAVVADRVVDVLELELARRRCDELHQRLGVSDERLATFAGQVSHDLKNPLTTMVMSLDLAQERIASDGESANVAPLLAQAVRGAGRMQTMLGELLTFARGGATPELQPVDLGVVMTEVRDDLAGSLGETTLVVDQLPTVSGDPRLLRAVLQNLVSNAVKFTREGVRPVVFVRAAETPGGWRVEVADNGRGIPEPDRARVFDPMVRLDQTVPGTGIGLATCRRAIEAHGGQIGVAPAAGGGALVWFELPKPSVAV